ncbi:hypothetical protein KU15F68_42720 [Escherichia coli]
MLQQDANKTKKTSQQAENDESWQSSDIEIMKCLANMTCGYGIIMVKMCIKSTGEHVTADKRKNF